MNIVRTKPPSVRPESRALWLLLVLQTKCCDEREGHVVEVLQIQHNYT